MTPEARLWMLVAGDQPGDRGGDCDCGGDAMSDINLPPPHKTVVERTDESGVWEQRRVDLYTAEQVRTTVLADRAERDKDAPNLRGRSKLAQWAKKKRKAKIASASRRRNRA